MIENPTNEQLKTLKGIVYLITNIINNKKYVGISKTTFRKRYYNSIKWWRHATNEYFQKSINKYGYKNFKISILHHDIIIEQELSNFETKYIKKFNTLFPNGYNFDKGGYKTHGKYTTKAKDWIFYDHLLEKMVYIHNLEKFCKENKLNAGCMNAIHNKRDLGIRKHHKQYTLPGVKLKKWKLKAPDEKIYVIFEWGIQEFCRQHNLKTDGIHQLCQGNLLTYKGWICLTTNVRKKKIYKIKYLNEKPISIIEGKISEFCRLNNLDAAAMNNVFRGKSINHKGWTLYNTKINFYEFINPENKIVRIPKLKGFLKNYCKINNLKYKSILCLISERTRIYKGWKISNC